MGRHRRTPSIISDKILRPTLISLEHTAAAEREKSILRQYHIRRSIHSALVKFFSSITFKASDELKVDESHPLYVCLCLCMCLCPSACASVRLSSCLSFSLSVSSCYLASASVAVPASTYLYIYIIMRLSACLSSRQYLCLCLSACLLLSQSKCCPGSPASASVYVSVSTFLCFLFYTTVSIRISLCRCVYMCDISVHVSLSIPLCMSLGTYMIFCHIAVSAVLSREVVVTWN